MKIIKYQVAREIHRQAAAETWEGVKRKVALHVWNDLEIGVELIIGDEILNNVGKGVAAK